MLLWRLRSLLFFFQAEDGIRDVAVTGVQTCALPICFDPRVVEVMERRYQELEMMVSSMETERVRLDVAPKVDRQVAPSSGFAEVPDEAEIRATSFLSSIISARQEAQLLFELAQTLGNSLSLKETLSVVAVRFKEKIPHDSIVFFF